MYEIYTIEVVLLELFLIIRNQQQEISDICVWLL